MGQCAASGLRPMCTRAPSSTWSSLERGRNTLRPGSQKRRSPTRIPMSSERRKGVGEAEQD